MEVVKDIVKKMGMVKKLRLGRRLVNTRTGKAGGVESTGPHIVKFLAEPTRVMGKNFEGKPEQQFKFLVEENGVKLRWMVSIMNKEGTDGSYLLERLEEIKIGDTKILEMMSQGARKYIDIRDIDGEFSEAPDEVDEEDEETALNKAIANEHE